MRKKFKHLNTKKNQLSIKEDNNAVNDGQKLVKT